jgi:xylulokinase
MGRSLIGIDVGTSAVKLAAYTPDGRCIAKATRPVAPEHTQPGWHTLDPTQVVAAVEDGLRYLGATLADEPPIALALSVSGDEVFPVAGERALGPCLLSGDTRGAEIEAETRARRPPDEWFELCGHVPERMDPINRVLWWRAEQPDVFARAERFLGWHEFLCLSLCGRAATDPGLASKWLAFDLASRSWSSERLTEVGIEPRLLPEVAAWGQSLGPIGPRVAADLGLPAELIVAIGGYDSSCAALGAGVADIGIAGLACGSWEVVVAPHPIREPAALGGLNASAIPYPAEVGAAALAQSPNGGSVLDWAASVLGRPADELERGIAAAGTGPSPVLAFPHLSGTISPWRDGRELRAGLAGLSLATTAIDIAQALLEAIAYELAITLAGLAAAGVSVAGIRAAGGGTDSEWWMQLKSDVTGLPIEIVDQDEPGCFGAALLAGYAAGIHERPGEAATALSRPRLLFAPVPERAAQHAQAIDRYRGAVERRLARMNAA